jgi:phage tail-like protein
MAPRFTVNPHRTDPYKNFKFRVRWEGRTVAGITKVSALKRTTEVIEYREGGEPSLTRRLPGQTRFEPVTLERGVTHDPAFEEWASQSWQFGAGAGEEVALASFRRDVIIDLVNEAGQVVLSYALYRCWVSEYVALPELDANANAVAIESITLENEGWERDRAVTEPTEPG